MFTVARKCFSARAAITLDDLLVPPGLVPDYCGMTALARHAGVLALFALVGLVRHLDLLFLGYTAEDSSWIQGAVYGTSIRLTSHFLLHDLGLHVFGERFIYYRVLGLAAHILTAYLLFCLALRVFAHSALPAATRPQARVGGALLTGLLFLLSQPFALQWLSAFAYMLVTFFCLLTVVLGLHSLRRGWGWLWLLAAGAYHLSLYSHSFSIMLPAFLLCLELGLRPPARRPLWLLSMAWRYALLAVVLGHYLLQNWTILVSRGVENIGQATPGGRLLEPLGDLFAWRLRWAVLEPYLGLEWQPPPLPTLPLLAVFALIAALGLAQIVPRGRRVGLAGIFTLFILIWGGITLPMELAAPARGAHWRACFLAAGVAMTLGYLATLVLAHLGRVTPGSGRASAGGVFLLAAVALLMTRGHITGARVSKLFSSTMSWQQEGRWNPDPACQGLASLSRAEVAARLSAGKGLRCMDLAHLDLRGLSLRGVDLTSARLTGANLEDLDLRGATLDGAGLLWARLTRCKLRGASLRGAHLGGARMGQCDARDVVLNDADLRWTHFRWADLRGASLDGAMLLETQFVHTDLRGVDLTVAQAHTANLDHGKLEGAILPDKWKKSPGDL
jgi:uncharacterized protein YjbI with pentapeptide repeats